ncbi:branched-chain amino acid ABC transporter permease [Agrobacterium vitis]|nr:branched-chain amino acid ABC transporter permease [Agrobacterium vitis]
MVLIVAGLAIVVNMMGIFNLAHGEFILLGAYVHWWAIEAGYPAWTGIVMAPIIVGVLGAALEIAVIRRFYSAPVAAMFATYAIGQVIRELVRWQIGGLYHAVPEPLAGGWTILGMAFPYWRLLVIASAIGVVTVSLLVLNRPHVGLRARAALENPPLARASGMSTRTIYTVTFATGAALAGFAGALIVPIYSLSADLGLRFLIQGFLAVLLGGASLVAGALGGAVAIGTLNTVLPWLVAPAFSEILLVAIALTLIRLKPDGIFGKEGR